jgi:nucleotide-binding universal stress UspA family protein
MFKHLLVPTDGSPLAQVAASRAVAFAREANARITFLCVEPPYPTMYLGIGAITDGRAMREFKDAGHAVARGVLEHCEQLAQAAGVACDTLALLSEAPYEAIIEAAGRVGADVIFMASHGHRGVKAMILGSETQKVLTHSTIPVLVYR